MRMHYLLKRQLKPYWEGMWQHLPTSAQVSQQLGTNTQLSRCLAFLIAPLLCQCLPQPDVLKKFSPRGPQISVNFYKYHSIATIYRYPSLTHSLLYSVSIFPVFMHCSQPAGFSAAPPALGRYSWTTNPANKPKLVWKSRTPQSDGWSGSQFTWQFGGIPVSPFSDKPQ